MGIVGGFLTASAVVLANTSICAGEKLLSPMARIFPALNNSSMAPAVSSIVVFGSGKWTW